MRRAFSQPLLGSSLQSDRSIGKFVGNRLAIKDKEGNHEEVDDEIEEVESQFQCMTLHKREPPKQAEEPYWEKYGLWRQEQKIRAARLQKQLKARWALEDLIDDQLNRFHTHYNRHTTVPTRPKDVTRLLMPKSVPAHELATVAWLGDWRPSAILSLLRSLAASSPNLSSLSGSAKTQQALSQLIHDIQIEEAVIDEEMAEIQATCILHLPFGRMKNRPNGPAFTSVQSEFKKIHAVITKAQSLRFKALEMVVKKVLSDTDAAEFLVAFAGIQECIHRFAVQYKSQKGKVSVRKQVGEKAVKRWDSMFKEHW